MQVLLPKVIFFDAAGTLIHLPKGAAWHYVSVARSYGIDLEEAAVGRAFRRAWQETPAPAETRARRPDDDKGWWRGLVKQVLEQCGVPPADWNELFFETLYSHFCEPEVWEVYPDVVSTLEVLRSRYRLGLISNFDWRLRKVLEHTGMADWFQYWVISSEVGADKPSSYIYQYAADSAGVLPGEALHVGDDPVCDWKGAEGAGFQVFELDRPRRSLSELLPRLIRD